MWHIELDSFMCLECHFVAGAGNKLSGFDAVSGLFLAFPG